MGRVEERISCLNVLIRDTRTVGTSVISSKGDAPKYSVYPIEPKNPAPVVARIRLC